MLKNLVGKKAFVNNEIITITEVFPDGDILYTVKDNTGTFDKGYGLAMTNKNGLLRVGENSIAIPFSKFK